MSGPTAVVKSKFVVDPNDNGSLIRRDGTPDPEREYWERVNEDRDTVSSVAKMFDKSLQDEKENADRKQSMVKVGKIKRDSFLENFAKNEDNYKDQVKTGKLNANDFLINSSKSDVVIKPDIRVGKLNKIDIFDNNEKEDVDLAKPKMQIGKLDPKNMFQPPSSEDKENEISKRNSSVIRKLNTRNLFENNDHEVNEKEPIVIGKINTKDIFSNDDNVSVMEDNKTGRVGKLKIQEDTFFEVKDDHEKAKIKVGKLSAQDMFNPSPTDEKPQAKFYKPTVQPKKIKVEGLFKESSEDQQNSYRPEIKVGRLDANSFLQNLEDNNPDESPALKQVKVGKLDTNKIYCPTEEDDGNGDKVQGQPVTVGRVRLSDVFTNEREEEPRHEIIPVGKLKHNIYNLQEEENDKVDRLSQDIQIGKIKNVFAESLQEKEDVPKVVLRGARRVSKGNRISCLIENLHTEKKNESDEDDKETEEDKEVEEIKLGRDRMSAIQNMFSGQERNTASPGGQDVIRNRANVTSPQINAVRDKFNQETSENNVTCSDFEELRDEGLVSANLDRFTNGKILGSQQPEKKLSMETNYIDKRHIESVSAMFEGTTNKPAEHPRPVPRKLKNTESLFQHNKEEYTDCVKVEVKVGKLDSNIFQPVKEENCESISVSSQSPVRVGKLNAESIFPQKATEDVTLTQKELRVGKLNKDVFTPRTETPPEVKCIEVGKISTKDLFKKAEENCEELREIVQVGKLSEDKLSVGSKNTDDISEDSRIVDPDLLSLSGKVSEKASAFLTNTNNDNPPSPKVGGPIIRRSESSAAADMQKKYQEQMASRGLKRNKTERNIEKAPSLVVKRENKVEKMVSEKNVTEKKVVEKKSIESPKRHFDTEEEEKVEHRQETAAMLAEATVEAGKFKEARSNFFQSMMNNSGQNTSAQRLGTSIMPTGTSEEWKLESSSSGKTTTSSSRGRSLFQRQADKVEEMESEQAMQKQILPGVDLEEIEDEFERLHREMMKDTS